MKIDSRASDQGGSKPLYTGVAAVKVVAINPTMSELQDMGYNPQQEPEYIGVTQDGHAKAVIDFYLVDPETGASGKRRFWLENKERITRAGDKFEFIDDYAVSGFAPDLDTLQSWVDKDTARKALVGEAALLSFVSPWANVNPFPGADGKRGLCSFEDISRLFSNDTSELKSILTGESTKDNKVKILFNVITTESGNTFQDIYPYHFERERTNSTKMWEKRLNDDFTQCKGDYQNSLAFQKYNPSAVVSTPQPDEAPKQEAEAGDAPW